MGVRGEVGEPDGRDSDRRDRNRLPVDPHDEECDDERNDRRQSTTARLGRAESEHEDADTSQQDHANATSHDNEQPRRQGNRRDDRGREHVGIAEPALEPALSARQCLAGGPAAETVVHQADRHGEHDSQHEAADDETDVPTRAK